MIEKIFRKNFIVNLILVFSIFLFDRLSKIYVVYLDNKFLGSGGVKDAEVARRYIDMGANFFLAGQDIGFLLSASKDRVDLLKG